MPEVLWRTAARVALVAEETRVLLISGRDPSNTAALPFWVLPGGGANAGEAPEQTARREAYEELGVQLGDLGPPVWQRHASFVFDSRHWEQDELFFVIRTQFFSPVATKLTDSEERWITGSRWWSLTELASTDEVVYPVGLAALLSAWLSAGAPPAPVHIR